MWKFLRHPHVLPLVGVIASEYQFAMVSDWMENGNANEYVKANPDVDRLGLVGFYVQASFSPIFDGRKSSSWQVSLRALSTSITTEWSMVISKE